MRALITCPRMPTAWPVPRSNRLFGPISGIDHRTFAIGQCKTNDTTAMRPGRNRGQAHVVIYR